MGNVKAFPSDSQGHNRNLGGGTKFNTIITIYEPI